MPLDEPPTPAELERLPGRRLAGRVLYRVYRRARSSPWWFASRLPGTAAGNPFDLPTPDGTCYLATSREGAVLEAFQEFGRGLIPAEELAGRSIAVVTAPPGALRGAFLTATRARAAGVTAALWAGGDRHLTQRWAMALRRAGWRALLAGLQHDPSGRLRGVALFDTAGADMPYGDEAWRHEDQTLADDAGLAADLQRYGIRILAGPESHRLARIDEDGRIITYWAVAEGPE